MIPIIFYEKTNRLAIVPSKSTPGSAGFDLFSCNEYIVPSKTRILVDIGIICIIPKGYYGRIAPRSGLAINKSIDIGGGVVDPDYTGSLKVIFINNGNNDYIIKCGERIAQIIFEKYASEIMFTNLNDNITVTIRGDKGFGSSGK